MAVTITGQSTAEASLRQDLAAAFRLAVHFDWHESVGNHFSAAIDPAGESFLLNPKWRHFSQVRASELLRLDATDNAVMQQPNPPDASAWCIHGCIHRLVPEARVLLHCHAPYATALAALADPTIYPIDLNTARFYRGVAYDTSFGGMVDEQREGERLSRLLQGHSVLVMGNHGIIVTGQTVPAAFESLYYLERAAKTLMLAYASGQPLSIMDDAHATAVYESWSDYAGMADAHFEQLKEMLDREQADYRD